MKKTAHGNELFKCEQCEYITNRKDALSKHFKRKPETQIESDNKKIKLQDCNDDFEDFQNWLNTNHTPIEHELDMEDVEKFVNNMHGKGTDCNDDFEDFQNWLNTNHTPPM